MANWLQRERPPTPLFQFRTFQFEDNSFIAVAEDNIRSYPIFVYNTVPDAWCEKTNYPKSLEMGQNGMYFDKQTQLLYCNGGCKNHNLYEINMEQNTAIVLSDECTNWFIPKLFAIGNDIHIIGGNGSQTPNYKHLIFNKKSKKMTEIASYNMAQCFDVLHMKKRKSLLIIAKEYDWHNFGEIWEYSLVSNTWAKWKEELPIGVYDPSVGWSGPDMRMVKSRDEQYILIWAAGYYIWRNDNNRRTRDSADLELCVFDIKAEKFKECTLECPFNGIAMTSFINLNSKRKDQMLVFGFVKECFREFEFRNMQGLPNYLIQFISHWISIEMIHFMQSGWKECAAMEHKKHMSEHWAINIDYILGSLKEFGEPNENQSFI